MSRHDARCQRLRRLIHDQPLDGLLVTDPCNVSYLTGFTGDDSCLLVTNRQALMLSDARFTDQLLDECPLLEIMIRRPPTTQCELLLRACKRTGVRRLGFEANHVAVSTLAQWQEKLAKVDFRPIQGIVEALRVVKDAGEIKSIRRAIQVAERALEVVLSGLTPQHSELDIVRELEYQIRILGGSGCSFPPIVAVGPRAALPHAPATATPLQAGKLVLIDWGARVGQYVSDLTRVFATAKISPKLEKVYRIVQTAQRQAIAAIRPGVTANELDRIARRVIVEAGYGRHFKHALGHGIGLQVHESPRLAARQSTVLRAGMVVTVEPGVYLPGWGGVRIEDDVLVTRNGHEVLSHTAKHSPACLFPQ